METKLNNSNAWRAAFSSLLGIVLCFFMYGCGQNLSRSEAGEIISKSKSFTEPIFYSLPVTKVSIDKFGDDWNDHLKAWRSLESMGYISIKELGVIGDGFWKWYTIEISLTEKGLSIFSHDQEDTYKTELCKKVLNEITGISIGEDGTAIVEYTWRYDDVSPITNVVMIVSDLKDSSINEIQKDKVLMRKYDDGWRID